MFESNSDTKELMMKRLARVEGQLRGIQKMILQDAECEKVAQQMTAARKALDKAFHEMLACMIEEDVLCVKANPEQAEQAMDEIKRLLAKYA